MPSGGGGKITREAGRIAGDHTEVRCPLEQATTSSLEALQVYSQGWNVQEGKGDVAALPYYQRAIQLDPSFAMAYRALGSVYPALGQPGRAREYFTKAFELRFD